MENLTQTTERSGTVMAYFSNRANAEQTITNLKEAGFRSDQLSLAVKPDYDTESISNTENASSNARSSQAKESLWDKIKDFFEGGAKEKDSYSDTSAEKGKQAVKGSNPYAYDFNHDSFSASLGQLDVPQDRAKYLSHRFEDGEEGAIIAVRADGREAEARQILRQNEGDLGENAATYQPAPEQVHKSGQRIQLLGEVLRIHKDRASTGEVRVHKEIVTEQQTIQVPVEREELVIERVAVNEQTPVAGKIGMNNETRIPLSEERVVAEKNNVVREEVKIGTKNVETMKNVTDSVRHEELRVEGDGLEQGNKPVEPNLRRSA